MPVFDEKKWNDDGDVQYDNNCYDYATDRQSGRTDRKTRSRPGKKANKEMRRSPYTCDDIMNGVDADVKAAAVGKKSDKDTKCEGDCWKVAVMRAVLSDGTTTDFHFVRQDTGGGWSHKQGDGPAKKTDDENKDIKDPETAKIDNYKVCGYFCFCPGMQVAMLSIPSSQIFASLVLKEPAMLTSRSLDLELPAGRLTMLYDQQVLRPQMIATASIFSGEENPSWELEPADVEIVRSKLQALPRTDRRPVYKISYQGFSLRGTYTDLPQDVRVLEGLISLGHGESKAWYQDIHGLERWLVVRASAQASPADARALIAEAAKEVLSAGAELSDLHLLRTDAVSNVASKSTDCGPAASNSVKIKDVHGEGASATAAVIDAHTNAKALGQASCEGGGCGGGKVCRYVEDNWEASAEFKDNKWVAKGTTSGHCACE